eukprot:Opistho-1_new@71999
MHTRADFCSADGRLPGLVHVLFVAGLARSHLRGPEVDNVDVVTGRLQALEECGELVLDLAGSHENTQDVRLANLLVAGRVLRRRGALHGDLLDVGNPARHVQLLALNLVDAGLEEHGARRRAREDGARGVRHNIVVLGHDGPHDADEAGAALGIERLANDNVRGDNVAVRVDGDDRALAVQHRAYTAREIVCEDAVVVRRNRARNDHVDVLSNDVRALVPEQPARSQVALEDGSFLSLGTADGDRGVAVVKADLVVLRLPRTCARVFDRLGFARELVTLHRVVQHIDEERRVHPQHLGRARVQLKQLEVVLLRRRQGGAHRRTEAVQARHVWVRAQQLGPECAARGGHFSVALCRVCEVLLVLNVCDDVDAARRRRLARGLAEGQLPAVDEKLLIDQGLKLVGVRQFCERHVRVVEVEEVVVRPEDVQQRRLGPALDGLCVHGVNRTERGDARGGLRLALLAVVVVPHVLCVD